MVTMVTCALDYLKHHQHYVLLDLTNNDASNKNLSYHGLVPVRNLPICIMKQGKHVKIKMRDNNKTSPSQLTMSCLSSWEAPGLLSSSVVLDSKPLGNNELSGGAFTMIALSLGFI